MSPKASPNPRRPSTRRRDRWREELTPFAPCSRLRGAECLRGFCAATGEMDECPRHRERRESVALSGPEQLLKRCVGRAPAKADQYAEGGIEDAAALHVEREVGGSPVSCHALLASCRASIDARDRHGPNHCHDLCVSSVVPDPRTLRDADVTTLVLSRGAQNGVVCTDCKQLSWQMTPFARHERSGRARRSQGYARGLATVSCHR